MSRERCASDGTSCRKAFSEASIDLWVKRKIKTTLSEKETLKYILLFYYKYLLYIHINPYSMNISEILRVEEYTSTDLQNAAVILHPKHIEKYWVAPPDVGMIFEQGSNFTRLRNPIVDGARNKYFDSEAWYMAQRFEDPTVRKMIALCSTQENFSKQAAYLLQDDLEKDPEKRVEYMRSALRGKFLNNKWLRGKLVKTTERRIIELTYWNDTFFGVSHKTLSGSNVLWKLLEEIRELVKKCA